MWKVVIVICALGNPCTVFEQDPMQYYHDKQSCIVVSESKHKELLDGFLNYGYYVESSAFTCGKDPVS